MIQDALNKHPYPWTHEKGSDGHYTTVKDANGKVVCRIPWSTADMDIGRLIAAVPRTITACEMAIARSEDSALRMVAADAIEVANNGEPPKTKRPR